MSSAMIVAALALPVATPAETPNYAARSSEQMIDGVISAIDGKYGLTVRDRGGDLDSVRMHRGTIIIPTGLQLKPGMAVVIFGRADRGTLDAGEIDAPLEAATRAMRRAEVITPPVAPAYVPPGTFQTEGPNAGGGG